MRKTNSTHQLKRFYHPFNEVEQAEKEIERLVNLMGQSTFDEWWSNQVYSNDYQKFAILMLKRCELEYKIKTA